MAKRGFYSAIAKRQTVRATGEEVFLRPEKDSPLQSAKSTTLATDQSSIRAPGLTFSAFAKFTKCRIVKFRIPLSIPLKYTRLTPLARTRAVWDISRSSRRALTLPPTFRRKADSVSFGTERIVDRGRVNHGIHYKAQDALSVVGPNGSEAFPGASEKEASVVPWDDDSNAHRLMWLGIGCLLVAAVWDGGLRWVALGMFAFTLLRVSTPRSTAFMTRLSRIRSGRGASWQNWSPILSGSRSDQPMSGNDR